MAGVHGLQHVKGFLAAHLAYDDAVGPHAQGVDQQLALAYAALAFDVGRTALQPDHVLLLQLQLGRVLDGDDALAGGDESGKNIKQGGLAGASAARHHDVQAGFHRFLQHIQHDRRELAIGKQIVGGQRIAPKRRMERIGPSMASGGMMALTREPSGRRASTMGEDSSTRRPTLDTIFSIMCSR